MPLDPMLAQLLRQIDSDADSGTDGTVAPVDPDLAQVRARFESDARSMTAPDQRDEVGDVQDLLVAGPAGPIPVRVYRPPALADTVTAGPAPVLLWLHGGGWMIGSLDTGDTVARALCARTGAVVVSVDYRLAPEHPWPAGLLDAAAAYAWLTEHAQTHGGDPARLLVGGDSAGANLAAVLTQQLRDSPTAPIGQVLLYPATDLDTSRTDRYPSLHRHATGYGLTTDAVAWCVRTYVPPGADLTDPHLSPGRQTDLNRLPPAVIAVAEFDPLHDQGTAYAAALRQAGNPIVLHDGHGLVHGCFDMLGLVPAARDELDRVLASVHTLLADGRLPVSAGRS